MSKYDLMVIVDAQKPQDQKETIFKQVTDAVTKAGGKVINAHVWLEKHKFSFKIKRCLEGTYYLVKFEGPTAIIERAKQLLRINDDILRYAVIGTD